MSPSDFVVVPAPPVALTVAGGGLFPVRRVYCVGRNYADHAREMGHDPDREPPFFFAKPADAVDQSGVFPYPPASRDVHHEIELVVFMSGGGRDIAPDVALDHVYGYAVGLDMTRRDLQTEAKKAGRPWDTAKGFDRSAPCSQIASAARIGHPASGAISLTRNGAEVQRGDLAQQIWSVAEIIACLSTLFELRPGDAIMTGTPAGVGPVAVGDVLEARIDGVGRLTVRVTE